MSDRIREFGRNISGIARSHRRSGVAILSATALGVVIAFIAMETGKGNAGRSDQWALPEDHTVTLVSAVDTILAEPLFGGEPVLQTTEEVEEQTDEEWTGDPWRLMGIVTDGDQRYAVVRNETLDKLVQILPGAELPGGERLVDVGENSIVFENETELQELSLFRDQSRTED